MAFILSMVVEWVLLCSQILDLDNPIQYDKPNDLRKTFSFIVTFACPGLHLHLLKLKEVTTLSVGR